MKILVSGSLAYDRIMDFRGRFEDYVVPDKMHRFNVSFQTDTLSESFGGTAGNIAYAFSLLGERPTILAVAGNDFGFYRSWLEDHDVDVSRIQTDASERTAFATIISDRSGNQIAAFYPGAMQTPWRHDHEAFPETDFAVIAAGNLADMRTFPAIYRRNAVRFMFDPGQQTPTLSAEDLKNGIDGAAILIANDYECALIEKKTGWSGADILEHADMVVTTLGERGSRILTKAGLIEVPAVCVESVKDPTGAGDAYRAGFVHALLKGQPLETCGKFAGLVASYVVETRGTQTHTFTAAELAERYQKNFNEALELF